MIVVNKEKAEKFNPTKATKTSKADKKKEEK